MVLGPFRVIIQGQSVGTEVLVGPLAIWSGVKPGVDWGAFDKHR